MADKFSVDRGALSTSATSVQGHGDDLAVSHSAAQRRMSGAGGGWTGQSAPALAFFSTKLESVSSVVVDRIRNHSQHMHSAVQKHTANEERRVQDMGDVDRA